MKFPLGPLVWLLMSQALTAGLDNNNLTIESDLVSYANNQMRLSDHVVIEHPLGRLNADRGFIDEVDKGNKVEGQTLPGFITLMAHGEQGTCSLDTPDGKQICATCIYVDTSTRKLVLENPEGHMMISRGEAVAEQNLSFSAKQLVWEEPFHTMTLRDQVVFNQGDMGTLNADDQVEVRESIENGKRILNAIISRGKTVLTYLETGGITHTLMAYGEIFIDHEQMEVRLTNPPNRKVHFKDNFGEFFSDKARVEYAMINYHIRPVKLILDGHVHVRNQFARVESPENPLIQYALADHIEYSLKTNEVTLSANKGERVLFYDKLNNVQVSAPALKMKRDPYTNQESIKGEGDVRFTFVKHELDRLQAYFEKGN
jgi:lipopolysaccharide export system protein LptA